MKIAILGETRLPVLPHGAGGLGRATHEIATELTRRGHDVTLFAPAGSEFSKLKPVSSFDMIGFEVGLDYSHDHRFSRAYYDAPVVNLIGDRECSYCPPNALVESDYMLECYPGAKKVKTGINLEASYLAPAVGNYLVHIGGQIGHKQADQAVWIAEQTGRRIILIGPGFNEPDEQKKWELIAGAYAMLCPYTIDASPRAPLEAAACGVPVLCLDSDGTKEHVIDGKTGFVCQNVKQMTEKLKDVETLNREAIRVWAAQSHDIHQTVFALVRHLEAVRNGARW